MIRCLLFFLAFLFTSASWAQDEQLPRWKKVKATVFNIGYGTEIPVGEMASRYGRNLKFTLGAERISKRGLIYGLDFSFMFGNDVKEDVLAPMRLDNGEVLGADNAYADVFLRQRGIFIGPTVGKLFLLSSKTRSGVRVTTSPGVFLHYIRVVDDASSLPQIEGRYQKGYDRLTRGLGLRQLLAYQHASKDERLNFYIGLEFTGALTRHVRAIDFDTGSAPSGDLRFDGLVGIKAAILFPFYDDYETAEIFY